MAENYEVYPVPWLVAQDASMTWSIMNLERKQQIVIFTHNIQKHTELNNQVTSISYDKCLKPYWSKL